MYLQNSGGKCLNNQNYETKIGHLIHDNINVEWMRYNMYKENNIYESIPLLVFRIYEEEENKIESLKRCISDYKGINQWKLFVNPMTRKKNYILSLDIIEKIYYDFSKGILTEFNPKEILDEMEYKKLCETAVQEIPNLESYLEDYFRRFT